jgi:hypothetical protein
MNNLYSGACSDRLFARCLIDAKGKGGRHIWTHPERKSLEVRHLRMRRMHISGLEQLRSGLLLGPRWSLRFFS